MRQQQNNKNRMRGRGRKPQNNANRNFESNGPDVKIRGNASHIAEKYTALARDALSAGDTVIAENYLQHAEHYNRIVLANNAAREEAQAAREEAQRQQAEREEGEQPDVKAGGEAAAEGADESEDRPKRRPRRRDSRGESREEKAAATDEQTDGEKANGSAVRADAEGDGEEAPKPRKRTTRRKADTPDNISADAAGLPQGLLGGASRETAQVDE